MPGEIFLGSGFSAASIQTVPPLRRVAAPGRGNNEKSQSSISDSADHVVEIVPNGARFT